MYQNLIIHHVHIVDRNHVTPRSHTVCSEKNTQMQIVNNVLAYSVLFNRKRKQREVLKLQIL